MQLSPSAEKALEAFEDGSKQCLDCEALLDNTFNIFSLLERWETAESVHRYVLFFVQLTPICNRSNVSSVQSIINEVREQGHAYFQTLSGSISVAISLNGLAQDVGHLADCLLDPACKPEEIRDFIAEMRGNTRDALEISKHISTAYRTVRTGINQVQLP